MTGGIDSPRVAALAERVDAGDRDAPAAFWAEVARDGAPLIEPVADPPDHCLVTFVWRQPGEPPENVVVFGGPAAWWDIAANRLERLTGSDLWYRSYRVRNDMRGRYVLSVDDPLTPLPREGTPEVAARERTFAPDPLNPKRLTFPRIADDPVSVERIFSVLELPDAPPQPWVAVRPGVPTGQLECHRFRSETLHNERRVWVHLPAGYSGTAEPYGLAVLLDGRIWAEVLPIAATLDNLTAAARIPPLVVAMVDTLDFATRQRELTLNEALPQFLADELVPWLRSEWNVTGAAERTLIQGQSYGGLAAGFVGLRVPDVFGNVSMHSASLWWPPDSEFDVDAEWLTRQFVSVPRTPVRFYVEIGLQEGSAMVPTSRHLRDVLQARGYDVHYREYNGGHDANCWRGGIADALQLLTSCWA
jgi:enterochelin esterase-like enzyme